MNAQWYLKDGQRLVAETKAVEHRFPGFVLGSESHGDLYWVGYLRTNFGSQFRLKVSYPPDYPNRVPMAFVIQPPLKPSPHRYGAPGDNALCLFHPQQGHSRSFDPARSTAASVIAWAAEWLACYEVFLRTGQWISGKPQHHPGDP